MTVSNNITKQTYVGNGITRSWSIPFLYTDNSQVNLLLTDVATGATTPVSTNYDIAVGGLTVNYPSISSGLPLLTSTTLLTVYRGTSILQLVDYTNQGGFYPQTMEASLDQLTMITQELSEQIGRAVKVSISGGTTADDLLASISASVNSASASATASANSATASANSATASANSATASANSATDAAGSVANAAAIATAAAIAKLPPIDDFIYTGRNITPGTGLQINLSAGEHYLSKTHLTLSANTLSLTAKKAALVYDALDGSTGKIEASLPAIDNTIVGRWIIDGSATIVNSAVSLSTSAVANNLTKNGTVTAVDGVLGGNAGRGDGATGYYVSANSTGFPIGGAERRIDVDFTTNGVPSANQMLWQYGTTPSGTRLYLYINTAGNLILADAATTFDTGFTMSPGRRYIISTNYESGSNVRVYVNGVQVFFASNIGFATATGVLYVFRDIANVSYALCDIHWVELGNKAHTAQQIAQMANALIIPCTYATPYVSEVINGLQYYDIATSENAISGGDYSSNYVKANAFNKDDLATVWQSLQIYTAITGVSYLGQKVSSNIKKIRHTNQSVVGNNASSVKVQWSYDQSTWTDIQTQALPTTASAVTDYDVASYSAVGTHYIRILANSAFASGMTWVIPELRMYTDVKPAPTSDIRSTLPANVTSLGKVLTSSSGLKEISQDYQYGRREGAFGGNRRQFLGWKYFSGLTTLKWDNPFGTRKVKIQVVWAQDANGTNECDVHPEFISGSTSYGVFNSNSSSSRITATVNAAGATVYNGSWQTSGYIGVWVEVNE